MREKLMQEIKYYKKSMINEITCCCFSDNSLIKQSLRVRCSEGTAVISFAFSLNIIDYTTAKRLQGEMFGLLYELYDFLDCK